MDIEKIILGCILIDNSIHDQLIPALKPVYFSSKNRYLFDKIKALYSQKNHNKNCTIVHMQYAKCTWIFILGDFSLADP